MREQVLSQITQYFLWSASINARMLLIIVALSSYVLVQIKRETRESTHSIATLNAGRLQVFCAL